MREKRKPSNVSGFSHTSGSRCMANDAMDTCVPFGRNVPSDNVTSFKVFLFNDTVQLVSTDQHMYMYYENLLSSAGFKRALSFKKLSTLCSLPRADLPHPSLVVTSSTSSRRGSMYSGYAAR